MKTLADLYDAAGIQSFPQAEQVELAFTFRQHQIDGLRNLANNTRWGIFDEMSCGKTAVAQAYALWLIGFGNKVIGTMPPILTEQFKNSLASTFIGSKELAKCVVMDIPTNKREAVFTAWFKDPPDILLLSFKMFTKYREKLMLMGYNALIVDEATAVKSPSNQIHKAVKLFAGRYGPDSNGLVLMTGSPIETNVMDAYGLVALMNPNIYGSQRAFEAAHCIKAPVGYNDTMMVVGYQNLPYLSGVLKRIGSRVLKKEVLDLPPVTITEYAINLYPQHQALYNTLVEEKLALLPDNEIIDLTSASALYQAVQRTLLMPELFSPHSYDNALLDMLDSLVEQAEGQKIIVFAWYQDSINMLLDRYKDLNPAVINGETVGNNRERQKQKFITDPSCLMLVANPKSGGYGLDGFQHVCSLAVFAEVVPFPGVFQQAISRVHRPGQGALAVNIYVLVARRTIAVKLRNDLVKKDQYQEAVMVDKRMILHQLMGENGLQGTLK